MDYTEIKEYELRFVIDQQVRLNIGSNVALENKAPTSADNFYWIDSVIHEPFGLMYHVYGVDKFFHACELYPLFPVLVSDDVLDYHDMFYHEGKIYECSGLTLDDDLNMWVVANENQESFIETTVMKVVATPDMFGWLYNEGPPHDHNRYWGDSRFLEDYIQTCLVDAVKNGFKMSIIVHEVCPHYNGSHIGKDCSCKGGFIHGPKLHEGKIIIDTYNLLRKSSSTIIH